MKFIKIKNLFFLVLVQFFIQSCSLSPQYAEDPQLISWVYRNVIDMDAYSLHAKEFIDEVMTGNIKIDGVDEGYFYVEGYYEAKPETFSQASIVKWFNCADLSNNEFTLKYTLPYFVDDNKLKEYFEIGSLREETHTANILKTDRQRAEIVNSNLVSGYIEYLKECAQNAMKVINWEYETNSQGDSYAGYLVTYEIGIGYYVLVHLIEFPDTERWEGSILYHGTSMSELSQYYE